MGNLDAKGCNMASVGRKDWNEKIKRKYGSEEWVENLCKGRY